MNLLPPNQTQLERATADVCAPSLDPSVLRYLHSASRCPTEFLPTLAIELSLIGDGWALAESESAQRALIAGAITLHKNKGTPASIRDISRRLGFGKVEIIEGINRLQYDGARTYNGHMIHGDAAEWASYRVILLDRPITNDQAANLRSMLKRFAPARCRLASLEYQLVPLRYNGAAVFDSSFNYGSA